MTSIWYVSFGSNMASERLALYLSRGRDSAPPTASKPFRLGHPVVFAGKTKVWGSGGVAFLDTKRSGFASYGRAWRITLGQFEDIYRQENGLDKVKSIEPNEIGIGTSVGVAKQRYGRVWRFSDIEGTPALTFTSGESFPPAAAAGPAYLRVIAAGLAQAWGMTNGESARYLHECSPNADEYSQSEIEEILSTPAVLPNQQ